MKIQVAKRAVLRILEAGEAVMLVGHAGVGKTSLMREIAKRTNRSLKILILSQMEPGDLIGLPYKSDDKTIYLKPDWFPEDGEKSIIFLDEINRAHPLVRHAIMQLILDRRVHNHILPEDTWIAAAMNPPDGYDVYEIDDPAFIDRFVWLWIENDIDDYLKYLKSKGLYLQGIEEIIEDFQEGAMELPKMMSTPRAWERALRISKNIPKEEFEEYGLEILMGILGKENAERLYNHILNITDEVFALSVQDILKMPVQKRMRMIPKMAILLKKEPDKFFKLVEKLPVEESIAIIRHAIEKNRENLYENFSKREELLERITKEVLRRRIS